MGHRHRSALKQQNKAFKGSSSKSKSLKEKRRTAAANAASLAVNKPTTKSERVQQSKQRRVQRSRDLHQRQVPSADGPPPKVVVLLPFSDSVCIDKVFHKLSQDLVQDHGKASCEGIAGMDMDGDDNTSKDVASPQQNPHYCRYTFSLPAYARNPLIPKKYQQNVLLIPAPRISETAGNGTMLEEGEPPERPSELLRYMDLCSCCDVLVCLFGGSCTYERSAFSRRGYKILQGLKLQGLPPSVIGVGCVDPSVLEPAHAPKGKSSASESLKFMRRFFESELGAERKFFSIGSDADWHNVLRALGAAASLTQGDTNTKTVAKGAEAAASRRRGHLLALSWRIAWHHLSGDPAAQPEPCLEACGLVRGAGLTCNLPVHITGVGDFVLSRIEAMEPAYEAKRREPSLVNGQAKAEVEAHVANLQEVVEALQPLQPLDTAAMEQTWPTGEEMTAEDGMASANRRRVRVPRNVGDYERAWLESDTDGTNNDSEEEANENSDFEMQEEEAIAANTDPTTSVVDEVDDDWKTLNGAEQQQMEADNKAYAAQRREAAEMEREFPDQVDTPLNISAKERFQKYRGLKSFRSSPWAKNEDLPIGYGRIIDVSNLKGLAVFASRAHAELCRLTGGFSGRFCRLLMPLRHSYMLLQLVQQHPPLEGKGLYDALVEAMTGRIANRFSASNQTCTAGAVASADADLMVPDFLLVSQLLQHETQVAVVHSQLTFCDDQPIKSKDPMLMACGFRRFPASPIYSEEPRQGVRSAAKWKFKRWAEPGSTLTATVYSPLVLPPSPCIMLRSDSSEPDNLRITAWGSVLPVNGASSRLIIKRVLLSGHPFKVHRRKAIVRFMFFNPDDVRWFTPIELHTKRGLRGNIVEPLGTHGYMKCKFSDYLKQSDEVLLPLYRRVFPKWYPQSWGGLPTQQPLD
ncbi:DUF663 domain-containing protein, related [Eimeria necatrix]|uniref:DUF663 domain-containing protein, related n=1 Tax=Eimeria necatrix TaxID=51315 RepID=U6MXJ8_9EIME|nr:DUF663 domain-containing protein, related [Eimeria necatrix]CDJ67748.1 DUF663 domain-containing protein, related [Eimeria necatrix]